MNRSKLEFINATWSLVLEDSDGDLFSNKAAIMAYAKYIDKYNTTQEDSIKISWGVVVMITEFLKRPILLSDLQYGTLFDRDIRRDSLIQYKESRLVPRKLITQIGGILW